MLYLGSISIFGAGPFNFGGSDGNTWITIRRLRLQSHAHRHRSKPRREHLLLLIILVITGIQFLASKKRIHY
jgi:hypothetical protein